MTLFKLRSALGPARVVVVDLEREKFDYGAHLD
jgi:hypothetical protein